MLTITTGGAPKGCHRVQRRIGGAHIRGLFFRRSEFWNSAKQPQPTKAARAIAEAAQATLQNGARDRGSVVSLACTPAGSPVGTQRSGLEHRALYPAIYFQRPGWR